MPFTFDDQHNMLMPVKDITDAVNSKKKKYFKHKLNMKTFNLQNLYEAHRQLKTTPALYPIQIVQHPCMERESVVFNLDNLTMYVGCPYHFIFWFNSVSGKSFDDSTDECFALAQMKIKAFIEGF